MGDCGRRGFIRGLGELRGFSSQMAGRPREMGGGFSSQEFFVSLGFRCSGFFLPTVLWGLLGL